MTAKPVESHSHDRRIANMSLTPITIRGKRKTPLTRPPLRFSKHPAKLRRTVASVRAARTLGDRPSLEMLPAEVLESIFLYSGNIALPRSSHIIGAKLSDRATRLRFFTWAFHETWDQWFGIPADRSICRGPWPEGCEEYLPCAGDPDLQSQVLAQPWADVDFILLAQQNWANKFARHRFYQHLAPWVDSVREAGHQRKGFVHFNASECFEADFNQALEWPLIERPLRWGGYEVHPRARIPVDLITGPWDEEKHRRLFWLVRGGATFDCQQQRPPPWEVRLDCLRNAVLGVSEPQLLIFNCLVGSNSGSSWLFQDLPQEVIRKDIVLGTEERLKWGADSTQGRAILNMASQSGLLHLDLSTTSPSVMRSKVVELGSP